MINCKQCKNKTICKFKDETEVLNGSVNESKLHIPYPFVVDIKCTMFSEMNCCGSSSNFKIPTPVINN